MKQRKRFLLVIAILLLILGVWGNRVWFPSPKETIKSGRFRRQFGQEGSSRGDLARPMHLEIRDRRLYVTEYLNDRIQVFNLTGESLGVIGESGSGPGQFDAPGGVAVAADGRLHVADFYNHRIQKFSSQGEFLLAFGSQGSGQGQFERPIDMAIDNQGNVFVVDFGNSRIQKFERDRVAQ